MNHGSSVNSWTRNLVIGLLVLILASCGGAQSQLAVPDANPGPASQNPPITNQGCEEPDQVASEPPAAPVLHKSKQSRATGQVQVDTFEFLLADSNAELGVLVIEWDAFFFGTDPRLDQSVYPVPVEVTGGEDVTCEVEAPGMGYAEVRCRVRPESDFDNWSPWSNTLILTAGQVESEIDPDSEAPVLTGIPKLVVTVRSLAGNTVAGAQVKFVQDDTEVVVDTDDGGRASIRLWPVFEFGNILVTGWHVEHGADLSEYDYAADSIDLAYMDIELDPDALLLNPKAKTPAMHGLSLLGESRDVIFVERVSSDAEDVELGDVLAIDGRIVEITDFVSMTEGSGTQAETMNLRVRDASVTDAIEYCTVNQKVGFEYDGGSVRESGGDMIRASSSNGWSLIAAEDVLLAQDPTGSLTAEVEIEFTPEMYFKLGIADGEIKDFKVALTGLLEASCLLDCSMEGSIDSLHPQATIDLLPPKPGVIWIGTWPVWYEINPALTVGLEFDGYCDGEFSAGAQGTLEVEVGVNYTDVDGWQTILDTDSSLHLIGPEFTASVSANARLTCQVEFDVEFYKLVECSMGAGPYLQFNLDAGTEPAPYIDYFIGRGLVSSVGFSSADLFGIQYELAEFDYYTEPVELASGRWELPVEQGRVEFTIINDDEEAHNPVIQDASRSVLTQVNIDPGQSFTTAVYEFPVGYQTFYAVYTDSDSETNPVQLQESVTVRNPGIAEVVFVLPRIEPDPNQSPTASLDTTPSPPMIMEGDYVEFDGSGSTDPEDDLAKFEFNPGDGSGWVDRGQIAIYTHRYYDEGSYVASLRVTDSEGLTDVDRVTVVVDRPQETPAPSSIEASAEFYNRIEVECSAVTGADVYQFRRARGSSGTFYNMGTEADPALTDWVGSNTLQGVEYFYQARAGVDGIWSDWSPVSNAGSASLCLVRGYILDEYGHGVSGVTVQLTGDDNQEFNGTAANGYYWFYVREGSYQVMPLPFGVWDPVFQFFNIDADNPISQPINFEPAG